MGGSVDYQEATSIRVGHWLHQKGFNLASCTGVAAGYNLSETDVLGILLPRRNVIQRRHLFGLITEKLRRKFLGTIWFQNSPRGASEENWVFEIYGREHVILAKELAEEMASTFNVKISVRLTEEEPCFEKFSEDYAN